MAITVTITHGAPNGTEEVRVACDLCSKVESVTFRASAVREPFDKARRLVVGPSSTEARNEAVLLLGESCPHVGDLQRMHSEVSACLPHDPIRAQWASAFTSKDSLKPLTTEEIAELRRMHEEASAVAGERDWGARFKKSNAFFGGSMAALAALPRLLDEVERSRRIPLADEHDVRKLLGIIERSRALLKRIEWIGAKHEDEPRWCQVCGGRETHPHLPTSGHRSGCELAALLGVVG